MQKRASKEFSGTEIEIFVYGDSSEDCIVRLIDSRKKDEFTGKLNGQVFHPYPDIGYLCIREHDDRPVITGMLRKRYWKNESDIQALIAWITEDVLMMGVQEASTIELTVVTNQLVSTDEYESFYEINNDDSSAGFFQVFK